MLIDAVEATDQDQFFGLADILGIHSKVDSLSIADIVVDHGGSDDGELAGEFNVAGAVIFYFADIDEILELFDDGEVHVSHFLLGDAVLSLDGLEGMEDLVYFMIAYHEFPFQLGLDRVRIGLFL